MYYGLNLNWQSLGDRGEDVERGTDLEQDAPVAGEVGNSQNHKPVQKKGG